MTNIPALHVSRNVLRRTAKTVGAQSRVARHLTHCCKRPVGLSPTLCKNNRLWSSQDGTSAVEFAIVAAPFLAILFATLELALIFIVNSGLDLGTDALATQIRTGQVQAPGSSVTSSSGVQLDLVGAKTLLCSQIQIVSPASCLQQLQIDVRPLTSFHQASSTSPLNANTFNSASLCYYSGNAGDIVEIRAYYLYPLIDPLLSYALSIVTNYLHSGQSSSGTYYLIQTTQVFKSENYLNEANSGAGC